MDHYLKRWQDGVKYLHSLGHVLDADGRVVRDAVGATQRRPLMLLAVAVTQEPDGSLGQYTEVVVGDGPEAEEATTILTESAIRALATQTFEVLQTPEGDVGLADVVGEVSRATAVALVGWTQEALQEPAHGEEGPAPSVEA